jgi:exopolyphosphatase/guanosine-5'-triphosphate,3'-diphosphate pyrophosphatase
VRVLEAEEEGQLAWSGVVATSSGDAETIAVCDVGGGSSELVVGTRSGGPVWVRSAASGALALTDAFLSEQRPAGEAIEAACAELRSVVAAFVPPVPLVAYATGGTARALRKVVGRTLGPGELDAAVRKLAKRNPQRIARDFDVGEQRARTLLGGALILAEIQRRLGVPLEVSRAGMREGVALTLLAEGAAA